MIGIDTNILVRYFVQDDSVQTLSALTFIESLSLDSPGFINLVTLAELYWVLRHSYKTHRTRILTTFETLLDARELLIERSELVTDALDRFAKSNADFTDCLIQSISIDAGCTKIMTFDKNAARVAGMTLLT